MAQPPPSSSSLLSSSLSHSLACSCTTRFKGNSPNLARRQLLDDDGHLAAIAIGGASCGRGVVVVVSPFPFRRLVLVHHPETPLPTTSCQNLDRGCQIKKINSFCMPSLRCINAFFKIGRLYFYWYFNCFYKH